MSEILSNISFFVFSFVIFVSVSMRFLPIRIAAYIAVYVALIYWCVYVYRFVMG